MNFKEVEKEYRFLKVAVSNGLEEHDTLVQRVENDFIVKDSRGDSWKIDIETGNWLWYDSLNNEWIKRKRPGTKKENEYNIKIQTPPLPQIPKQVKEQIKKADSEGYDEYFGKKTEEKSKEEYKDRKVKTGQKRGEEIVKICPDCGMKSKKNPKYCPMCGNEMKILGAKKTTCFGCGSPIKPDAKFCPNCGVKVEKKKQKKYCHNCGEEVKKDQKFCASCGQKLI